MLHFPVVMYGCESWTVKKAEHWRTDAFELWCWRRLLRVPWTARRSNQSILKEISPGCSLEGLMVKLKLQYFGHLMRRVDSLEKTLMLGGIGGRRRRGCQRMRWLDGIIDLMHEFGWIPRVGDGQGGLACCNSWCRKELDTTERLNWLTHIRKKRPIIKTLENKIKNHKPMENTDFIKEDIQTTIKIWKTIQPHWSSGRYEIRWRYHYTYIIMTNYKT